jgi:predicted transcriptional regulator
MTSIKLTSSQKNILSALINLHSQNESAVKGRSIAEEVDRNSGTIRNQMQSLKSLQLVKGFSGPKGGYKPTSSAYETLDIQRMDDPAQVPIQHRGEEVTEANVDGIDLSSVHHPELCRAEVHLRGSIGGFHKGDSVIVGPTPLSKLLIGGTVDGKDDVKNVLILRIDNMQAPVGGPTNNDS